MSEMASDVEAQKLIYEGYDLLCKAFDIQENHYALHKWISIFLNKKSILEGTKAHIKESYNIKKHMLVRYLTNNYFNYGYYFTINEILYQMRYYK